MLQTVPIALRAQQVEPIAIRFGVVAARDARSHRRALGRLRLEPATARDHVQTLVTTLLVAAVLSSVVRLDVQPRPHPRLSRSRAGQGPPRTLRFTHGVRARHRVASRWHLGARVCLSLTSQKTRGCALSKPTSSASRRISSRATAELARLRSQLEPHFLLNTLNAIAGLVTENPREARRLIACLGDLLRDSLARRRRAPAARRRGRVAPTLRRDPRVTSRRAPSRSTGRSTAPRSARSSRACSSSRSSRTRSSTARFGGAERGARHRPRHQRGIERFEEGDLHRRRQRPRPPERRAARRRLRPSFGATPPRARSFPTRSCGWNRRRRGRARSSSCPTSSGPRKPKP